MMFCQLQPGFRLSRDEETPLYLVPAEPSVAKILRQNGAREARARRDVPRRSEPLPPSIVLLLHARRRTAYREPDTWIPGGGFPSVFMTPPPIRSWGSPRISICSLTS